MTEDANNTAPEQALLDLHDLCNGLLYNVPDPSDAPEADDVAPTGKVGAASPAVTPAPEADAVTRSTPSGKIVATSCTATTTFEEVENEVQGRPHKRQATSAPAAPAAKSPRASASAPSDDEESGGAKCWGGMLKGDASCCTPGFASGKAHFKNKFCAACCKGIAVEASRVRAVHPDVRTLYANSLRAGFWKASAPALGGGEVRVANNTITCDGPWLVVYREEPHAHAQRPPWAVDLPEGWASPDGLVRFAVAKGTLVPLAEMAPKKPTGRPHDPSAPSPNAGKLGFGGGPKRQRRAPSFADQPEGDTSMIPPGGLPPSVRRSYSGSSALSASLTAESSPSLEPLRELPPSGCAATLLQPPMVVPGQGLPPLMVPSPSGGPSPSQRRVVGACLLSASSSASSSATSFASSGSFSTSFGSSGGALGSAAPSPPTSPSELATRLAATYEHAAALLEAALRPVSPLRCALSAEHATALLAQLNATRAAIETCRRVASEPPGGAPGAIEACRRVVEREEAPVTAVPPAQAPLAAAATISEA